ncbi:MAG: hypothetical protein KC482_11670 [Dehalococcoidia bacterium]|nr:hypothetical protein [Dehalococcoidia bacterium]MCA9824469.1 hypothetical protein [Dehalococcoidia bacterium]MCA9843669.1 hypothetical protein [Dehalococcoidia bacterium]MCA9854233.1 hypothetical protein [Dehalococcoidia bacterium]
MAELNETRERHAKDVVANNMASLMGDFTPAAMTKVMGIAANPIQATSYEIKDLGNNEAEITYIGSTRRTIWSKWEQNGEKWQIADLSER